MKTYYRFLLLIIIIPVLAMIFCACEGSKNADCMLIYFGMEFVDDKDYPTFEYYYPSEEFENTDYAHIVMVYKGDYKDNFKYGDIVTTDIPIDLSSYDLKFRENGDVSYNPYADLHELDPATKFSYSGNVYEDMERRTLVVTDEKYWADYEDNFTTLTMKDKDGRIYSFSYLWRNPEEGRPDIMNNSIGDTVEFAVRDDNAIMKLSEAKSAKEGTIIVPDVDGSFDKEEFFIYIGRDNGDPVFHYYSPDDGETYEHLQTRSVFFKGTLPKDIRYGDVFVTTDKAVKITRSRNIDVEMIDRVYRISDELEPETKLEYAGNGFEIMPKKELILGNVDYVGFDLFSCDLFEPDLSARYSYDYFSTVTETDPGSSEPGKPIEFICYRNTLILPALP